MTHHMSLGGGERRRFLISDTNAFPSRGDRG
jgi:hypothetical protein